MIINYRQGIINFQSSPNFVEFVGGVVNLNVSVTPLLLTLAHGDINYLHEESNDIPSAWSGSFTTGIDYWLYIDLNINTAIRTFGSTEIQPTFGNVRPNNPVNNQHFFDTTINQMVVWDATLSKWDKKLRLFITKLSNGTTLVPYTSDSQINEYGSYMAGYILSDINNALRRSTGQFLTTETPLYTLYNMFNDYQIEAIQKRFKANAPIKAYHAVTFVGENEIEEVSAAITSTKECTGIITKDIAKNETTIVEFYGLITNPNWNFTASSGSLVFVGTNGEVTDVLPKNHSMQRLGQVINPTTIFLDIQPRIILSHVGVSFTPAVTPTLTPTPTG